MDQSLSAVHNHNTDHTNTDPDPDPDPDTDPDTDRQFIINNNNNSLDGVDDTDPGAADSTVDGIIIDNNNNPTIPIPIPINNNNNNNSSQLNLNLNDHRLSIGLPINPSLIAVPIDYLLREAELSRLHSAVNNREQYLLSEFNPELSNIDDRDSYFNLIRTALNIIRSEIDSAFNKSIIIQQQQQQQQNNHHQLQQQQQHQMQIHQHPHLSSINQFSIQQHHHHHQQLHQQHQQQQMQLHLHQQQQQQQQQMHPLQQQSINPSSIADIQRSVDLQRAVELAAAAASNTIHQVYNHPQVISQQLHLQPQLATIPSITTAHSVHSAASAAAAAALNHTYLQAYNNTNRIYYSSPSLTYPPPPAAAAVTAAAAQSIPIVQSHPINTSTAIPSTINHNNNPNINRAQKRSSRSLNSNNNTNIEESPHRRKRGQLTKEAVDIMKSWLFEHFNHPYPTQQEQESLAEQIGGITAVQVNYWFINARVRIWRPLLDQRATETGNYGGIDPNIHKHKRNRKLINKGAASSALPFDPALTDILLADSSRIRPNSLQQAQSQLQAQAESTAAAAAVAASAAQHQALNYYMQSQQQLNNSTATISGTGVGIIGNLGPLSVSMEGQRDSHSNSINQLKHEPLSNNSDDNYSNNGVGENSESDLNQHQNQHQHQHSHQHHQDHNGESI